MKRVTPLLLDVLRVLDAAEGTVHGFAIAKAAGRSHPAVYAVLKRLRNAGWVDFAWEELNARHSGMPPRRFYWLTVDGAAATVELLGKNGEASG